MKTIKITPKKDGDKTGKQVKIKLIPKWSPKAPGYLTTKPKKVA